MTNKKIKLERKFKNRKLKITKLCKDGIKEKFHFSLSLIFVANFIFSSINKSNK